MKQQLKSIAESFNQKPLKNEWLQMACDVGLIERVSFDVVHTPTNIANPEQPPHETSSSNLVVDANKKKLPTDQEANPIGANPQSVAVFLKSSPGLGKVQIGEFISKGPADLYPFHAKVLHGYVRTFDFLNLGKI